MDSSPQPRTLIISREQFAEGYAEAMQPTARRPFTVIEHLPDGNVRVEDPYADHLDHWAQTPAEVQQENAQGGTTPIPWSEPNTRATLQDLQAVQALARASEAGKPAVRHTGVFEHRTILSREEVTLRRGQLRTGYLDWDHRIQASRELGAEVLAALGDGRRYVVVMDTEKTEDASKVEWVTHVTICLLDPRDAQVGEAVWRVPSDPSVRVGRPNFVYNELAMTAWSMAPGAWIRER